MAPMSIRWHEDCLANQRRTVALLQDEYDRMAVRLAASHEDVRLYELQIETAKAKGKATFDRDKYLRGRGKVLIAKE